MLLVVVLVFALVGCGSKTQTNETASENGAKKTIGVVQIVEHPALDGAREGFMKALEDGGYGADKITFDYQNAQGDVATANTIAAGFASGKVDMVFAIATPSAQAAYNATKDIPILITAVTDPVDAGIVDSMEKSGNNVTGTSDLTPIKKQFELLQQLYPNAKNVGIVYNTGEANSEVQVNIAKELAGEFGFTIIEKGVTSVNEIAQALDSLLSDIDVLYAPTDNMIANAMALVGSKATEKKIPIIAGEQGMVSNGALATEGINYYQLGYQTGEMAIKVLEGAAPSDVPLTTLEKTELVINSDVVEKLGLELPEKVKSRAKLVTTGE